MLKKNEEDRVIKILLRILYVREDKRLELVLVSAESDKNNNLLFRIFCYSHLIKISSSVNLGE